MGFLSNWIHSAELEDLKAKHSALEADMKTVCTKLMNARLELKLLKLRHPGFTRDPKTGRFLPAKK